MILRELKVLLYLVLVTQDDTGNLDDPDPWLVCTRNPCSHCHTANSYRLVLGFPFRTTDLGYPFFSLEAKHSVQHILNFSPPLFKYIGGPQVESSCRTSWLLFPSQSDQFCGSQPKKLQDESCMMSTCHLD